MEYTYNRQGERTTKKDQNETVHAFDYDLLGRPIEDRVTAVGTGVDDAVRRIATRYTVRGQVETITSYDDPAVATGTVLNQVQYLYNAFNQLIADYQNHSGAVDMVTTPKVAYTYTDGSSGHVRPTQLVYPNGRILRYEYSPGTDDALNRISFLADDDSGAVGTHLAEYAYLGTNHFIQVTYPEPNLRYDLAHGTGDDPYDGLDRFDRIIDLVWRDQNQSTDVERIQHGYDRSGNRLWRETPVAATNGVNLDELYTYDGMNQLVTFARGDLNAAKDGLVADTKSLAQQWSLDATGNWSGFQEDSNGDGTWDLEQSRGHNPVNEITELAGSSIHVAHDRAGNMTCMPKPNDWNAHYDLIYDAWHRLMKVRNAETVAAEYAYDGRNFRTTETCAGSPRHYFYSRDWQLAEERLGSSVSADRQFVWGLRYVDDLVVRDRDTSGDGVLDERFYVLQDPNWNVVAISGITGTTHERCTYTAYGVPQVYTGLFGSRASSPYDWETLYCGCRWDKLIASYHVRHRVLFSHLGRWNRQDPVESDFNLYRYVGNNPATLVDPFGLWGPGIHQTATTAWANSVAGYPAAAASAVGSADDAVDSNTGGTGPAPSFLRGDQSYHFNRNLGGGEDSRMVHFRRHFAAAKRACSPQNDDPNTAARELGTSLHPLQDWIAHGDHCATNPGEIGEFHNSRSPQTEFGDPSGYPDDPTLDARGGPDGRPAGLAIRTILVNGEMAVRDYAIYERGTKRLHLTADMTIARLKEFRDGIDKRACKCRKYFGL